MKIQLCITEINCIFKYIKIENNIFPAATTRGKRFVNLDPKANLETGKMSSLKHPPPPPKKEEKNIKLKKKM